MLYIASDHAGFELKGKIKSYLALKNIAFEDLGPNHFQPDDNYPDYAAAVAQKVSAGQGEGILICDTGIGMDIAANKFKNVRAALCTNVFMAKRAREHNNANILVLGAEIGDDHQAIIETFLQSKFTGEKRHIRRIEKISKLEK